VNRVAAAVALVVVLAVSACTDDDGDDQVVTAPTSTTAPAGSETSTTSSSPSSTTTPTESQPALWPAPGTAVDDPAEAAAGFVTGLLGGAEPALGEFQEGGPGAGEIEVLRQNEGGGIGGIRSVLSLRQLGEGWFVTSAQSPAVTIDEPQTLATVAGTIEVAGSGRGFEGTLLISLRTAGEGGPPLAETFVTAGASEELEPFTTELDIAADPGTTLALVVGNADASNGELGEFTAIPLVTAP